MSNGIFSALSGSITQEKVLEILANNLANINTNGYKEEKVSFKVIDPDIDKQNHAPIPPDNYKIDPNTFPLIGNDIKYVGFGGVSTDHSQGSLKRTSNPLDFAIAGSGFLQVETHAGTRYTRAGNLTLGPNGILQTINGDPVQGHKGAIHLQNPDFEVNEEGEIYQNKILVDRIKLINFQNKNLLQKVGENNFIHNGSPNNLTNTDNTRVLQGYVEGSNVNALQNLTNMIMAQRSYEAYQKVIKTHDDRMGKANTLGEIRA